MVEKREVAAAAKKKCAVPECVLNDYMRVVPHSGWSRYIQQVCPHINLFLEAVERALGSNVGKHGDFNEWQKVRNNDLYKDKFARHYMATIGKKGSVPTPASKALSKAHKDSAITNAMFLAYFDLQEDT